MLVSELFYRTERPVEPDGDAGGAADCRRAPAAMPMRSRRSLLPAALLARSGQDRAMGGRMRARRGRSRSSARPDTK